MPRATKAAEAAAIKPTTLVIDNGGFTIKAGFVSAHPAPNDCHIIPNCVARDQDRRVYVASQLAKCKDFYHAVFRRPVEKGMIVNWDLERSVWYQSFLSEKDAVVKVAMDKIPRWVELTVTSQCDPHETNLILTEAPNVFQTLQSNCDQMVFEEFEFASYYRSIGPSLNSYHEGQALFGDTSGDVKLPPTAAEFLLLVDSGFSHTTVTPLLRGKPVQEAIKRLDVGGKHLTNYLTELLAIHEISLKEDPWIANEVKEATCFVSDDFKRDMERTWRGHTMDPTIAVDVQLPDYQEHFNVIVKPFQAKDQTSKSKANIATLGNERFQVPELLFHPNDAGLREAGLPELIMQSISHLPENLHPGMLASILVVGGNVKIPGFVERLRREVRQLAPAQYEVNLIAAPDPEKATWLGGARMATNADLLKKHLVTRQQYLEHGPNWPLRRFAGLE